MIKLRRLILVMAILTSLSACVDKEIDDTPKNQTDQSTVIVEQNFTQEQKDEITAEDANANKDDVDEKDVSSDTSNEWPQIDVDEVKPNELGEVMIAMYHSLANKNSEFARTVNSFKEDLQKYYDMGFRPINLSDYVNGYIDVKPGFTPMVLTFDDGHRSNFNYIQKDEQWIIDPDCNVGILIEFNKTHPDWALKGSFFLNGGTPFAQAEFVDEKINFLIENGFEIGNHSYGHEDLTKLNAEQIQKTLGSNIQELEARIDKEDYIVNTLALPFGKRPSDDKKRYDLITEGTYNGVSYKHIAILLVGWKPEVSVFDKKFNPLAIMRVQSGDGELQMTDWLAYYESHPEKRYVSDGNPYTLTIPQNLEDKLNTEFVEKTSITDVIMYDAK